MVFRRSPGLGNANLGAKESGEPSAFRWSLAACWAVRAFPALGDGPTSTLQMFPVPPREPSSSEKRAVGHRLSGLHVPMGSLPLAGFHGRECRGDANVFVFSPLKNAETVIYCTSVVQREWAEWGSGRGSCGKRRTAEPSADSAPAQV